MTKQISNSKQNVIIFFLIAVFLCLPIDLLQNADNVSGMSISLILVAPSLLFYLIVNHNHKKYLTLAFCFSILSVIVTQFLSGKFESRHFFSVIYFFAPVLTFYLGKKVVSNSFDLHRIYRIMCIVSVVFVWVLFISIILKHNGMVRTDSYFNGDFFGLVLSGSYGIHSLGAHLFILMFVLHFYLVLEKVSTPAKVIIIISILQVIYMIVLSLSRELVLALLFYYAVFYWKKLGVIRTFLAVILIAIIGKVFFLQYFDAVLDAWATKLDVTKSSSNLNELSSGRIDLQELAIQQLFFNPFFGTGFQGYILNFKSYKGYDNLDGWSTHIYYLTALWKMGIFAFAFYFIYWLKIIKGLFRIKNPMILNDDATLLIKIFILSILFVNLFWDAFLAPNVMALFAFFCGTLDFCISRKKKII
ncbi:O-antigen ligase family protein [Chryseobacterium sp.]|uniref:O-antigen ligase family protein n=1 Tax=Chryseobacterium sp. TaxID=1871047 RepID=UPI000EE5B113|nr:O-antigen ligase family protein [Chryseobacterium sp.]HCM33538.1 hypothetical protein [Chryseobacterium sp.]